MRPIAVIVGGVALLAAGLAAFLANHWLESRSSRTAKPVIVMADVLVAARPLPAGTVITANDLRYDHWPKSSVPVALLGPDGGKMPTARFVGAVTRYALVAGQPMSPGSVFRSKGAGVMSGMLKPGMRAVSISITPFTAVSGFAIPGDRVDVLLSADITKRDGVLVGPVARYATQTILRNVQVLAIDQQLAPKAGAAALTGNTATLEVTPRQAEILTTARMMGTLSLTLRSFARTPVAVAKRRAEHARPYIADIGVSSALRAVRASERQQAGIGGAGGNTVVIDQGGSISRKSF